MLSRMSEGEDQPKKESRMERRKADFKAAIATRGLDAALDDLLIQLQYSELKLEDLQRQLQGKDLGRSGSGSERLRAILTVNMFGDDDAGDAPTSDAGAAQTGTASEAASEPGAGNADDDNDHDDGPGAPERAALDGLREQGRKLDKEIAEKKAGLHKARRARAELDAMLGDAKPQRERPVVTSTKPMDVVDHGTEPHAERCPCCGELNRVIERSVRTTYEWVPGHYVKHVRTIPTVVCSARCADAKPVTSPSPPVSFLPGSSLGHSVPRAAIAGNFADQMPLYRQIEALKRQGVEIAESTLRHNCLAALEVLDDMFREVLEKAVVNATLVQLDPTSFRVLDSKKKPGSSHRGTVTGFLGDAVHPFLKYTETASPEDSAWKVLDGFKGKLLTDGSNHFNRLSNGMVASALPFACNAHARRRFVPGARDGDVTALTVLELYRQIARVETLADLCGVDAAGRAAMRGERSRPLMERLRELLNPIVLTRPPTEPLTRAAQYFVGRFSALSRFLDHGDVPPDNNRAERLLRTTRLLEKNAVFAGNHDSAKLHATAWSLIATCKVRGIDPLRWFTTVLDRIRDGWPKSDAAALLPGTLALPA